MIEIQKGYGDDDDTNGKRTTWNRYLEFISPFWPLQ